MDPRRMLWLMALILSIVFSIQYYELVNGFVLSLLFSFGKSQVTADSVSARNSSVDGILNTTKIFNGMDPGEDLKWNLTSQRTFGSKNDSQNSSSSQDLLRMNHTAAATNSSSDNLTTGYSLPFTSPDQISSNKTEVDDTGLNIGKSSTKSTYISSSKPSNQGRKKRDKKPPAVVVPISAMNDLLYQSHISYQYKKPMWPSQVDQQLYKAKEMMQNAETVKGDRGVDIIAYRNFSAFVRSYELMDEMLKIYIYTEGERPIFHQSELDGIYASEGWFLKLLEENNHFVTKNPNQAHLFFLPFSSRQLKQNLYVQNSHSHKNMVQYLKDYLQTISKTHKFWNRTDGADHFLVACHDWAPSETSQIMQNCIRALCNADVTLGFQFGKDVSLPETYVRLARDPLSGLGGKPPSQRQILAFFAGRMHGYLRPILLHHWENKDPDLKIFGKIHNSQSYTKYMKNSKYCISARGYEAFTPRVVEAIFYECVPVIISDNYVPPFFETLNWESFAVFILEKDIPKLKNILVSIPEKQYIEMQRRVKHVQKHFLWHKKPVKYDIFHMILHSIWST